MEVREDNEEEEGADINCLRSAYTRSMSSGDITLAGIGSIAIEEMTGLAVR